MIILDIFHHFQALIASALAGTDVFTGLCWLVGSIACAILIYPKSSNF
jgi:hypothetical protein